MAALKNNHRPKPKVVFYAVMKRRNREKCSFKISPSEKNGRLGGISKGFTLRPIYYTFEYSAEPFYMCMGCGKKFCEDCMYISCDICDEFLLCKLCGWLIRSKIIGPCCQ